MNDATNIDERDLESFVGDLQEQINNVETMVEEQQALLRTTNTLLKQEKDEKDYLKSHIETIKESLILSYSAIENGQNVVASSLVSDTISLIESINGE